MKSSVKLRFPCRRRLVFMFTIQFNFAAGMIIFLLRFFVGAKLQFLSRQNGNERKTHRELTAEACASITGFLK